MLGWQTFTAISDLPENFAWTLCKIVSDIRLTVLNCLGFMCFFNDIFVFKFFISFMWGGTMPKCTCGGQRKMYFVELVVTFHLYESFRIKFRLSGLHQLSSERLYLLSNPTGPQWYFLASFNFYTKCINLIILLILSHLPSFFLPPRSQNQRQQEGFF